jgi:hydrogenase assembly chaperone HypC/HupF
MCLIVPSRVVALDGQRATIELPDGQHATVDASLVPEVGLGQYVLVDRGLVLEVIDPAEADAILAMYAEIGDVLADGSIEPP